MLLLSRRVNEEIRIGEDIKITVVHIRNGAVKLGIKAPKYLNVCRPEADHAKKLGKKKDQASAAKS